MLESFWKQRIVEKNQISDRDLSGGDFLLEAPPAILELLRARGLFPDLLTVDAQEKFLSWLNPSLRTLQDPLKMQDLKKSVERLAEAFAKQERICLYADFDLDGTSGLALMVDGFQQLGFKNVFQYQPKRLSEGYGFHANVVEDLKQEGVSLIVTIDVGITAFEAVEKAKELGIQVIITDHHQMQDTLPRAFSVINPNRKDDRSGLGYLCGAGVAFYVLRALKRELVNQSLISESVLDLKSLLDAFTIGTLTDMVPLVGDNRVLVKHGLAVLENTKRHGLRALLDELDLTKRSLTAQDVAIRFAPKLNALSRMELGVKPIDIFQAPTRARATELMTAVFSNNATRVSLQEEGEVEALRQWESWEQKDFFIATSDKFHRGVVGLIATKVVQEKNIPVYIGAVGEDGVVTGSARMPQGRMDSLLDAMSQCERFFNRFGGHDMAAGFEFHHSQLPEIVTGLSEHYAQGTTRSAKAHYYDIELKLPEIDEALMSWLEKIGPFGQGFEVPIFCLRNLSVDSVNIMKGKHLKIKVYQGKGAAGSSYSQKKSSKDLLLFSAPKIWIERPPQAGDLLDVLAEVQWNYFSGKKSLQLLVKDMKPSDLSFNQSLDDFQGSGDLQSV